jgi:tRNA1Val (adenine37-N6)-methyltransferase
LFDGAVTLLQPRDGYRVNVDSLLLGAFAAACRPEAKHLVDLGAGVGAVALAYARFGVVRRCTLVERDAALLALGESNLTNANVGVETVALDVTRGMPKELRGAADVVVSNPPFFPKDVAVARHPGKAGARAGALGPFLTAAAVALGRRGYVFFVYPAASLAALLHDASSVGLVAKRLCFVHPFAGAPARLSLIELRQAKPGGLVVLPPLIEWTGPGKRSPELARIVAGTPGALSERPIGDPAQSRRPPER